MPEEAEQVTGTPMKQRCGIYARVSTREKGQDTENQLFQLREYCARQGWTIAHEYMDHESAKTGKREAFQRLFTDASRRKFDVVLVWALDRFVGRNLHPNTESSKATLRGFG